MVYRYSVWDGQHGFPDIDKDRLLSHLERNLTEFGDLPTALWKLQREGMDDDDGHHLPGNRELYQRLEDRKRELSSLPGLAEMARALRRQIERITEIESPPGLPEDVTGQLAALKKHPFTDPAARQEFDRLMKALRDNSLEPLSGSGSAPVGAGAGHQARPSLSDALELLSELQLMDRLEAQLRQAQRRHDLSSLDTGLVSRVLGPDSARGIERLRRLDSMLLNAGFIREQDDRWELTPRAIRRIGQRALEEIYARIRRDAAGTHPANGGPGGERTEETHKYEFGDDFNLHLLNTVMNSLRRAPRKPPLSLLPDDFETIKTQPASRAATALLLDLSRSMPRHGNFQPAKRTALALSELVRSRFPTDSLYVIGFSTHARQIRPQDLPVMSWDERDRYTNIQHALWLACRLLSRNATASKQVLLVTDGEPTAHIDHGRVVARFPPTHETRLATLAEVRNCTADGITINVFIFEGADYSQDFITGLTRINRGRVFFTSKESLGRYVLMDYVARRHKILQ
jgi:uncharacterized protein with von Willebrand factor type A (vWA) domain